MINKKKIFNDPIYGFITIPGELIFDIVEHPYFQRLRRIKQLGMTDLVYPGALHTRFHHALGAMHLMGEALTSLRSKGHEITDHEIESAQIAILLHDIGHGPMSHALEFTLLDNVNHEKLTEVIIHDLNKQFNGALDLAIKMFEDKYERKFFNQLISSQLDIDRMDYLQRDSFFTGVSEGTIGAARIIKMLEVHDNELVVEEKGIYSVENFLNARRLMYWQVYLHKATVSAEKMMIQIIRRARMLSENGTRLQGTDALLSFLKEHLDFKAFASHHKHLEQFTALDDHDIWGAIKIWTTHKDPVLSDLSKSLLSRKLFKIVLSSEAPTKDQLKKIRKEVIEKMDLGEGEVDFYVKNGTISNSAYFAGPKKIGILTKKGEVIDVAEASDLPNIKALSKIVEKHYVCWPKIVTL